MAGYKSKAMQDIEAARQTGDPSTQMKVTLKRIEQDVDILSGRRRGNRALRLTDLQQIAQEGLTQYNTASQSENIAALRQDLERLFNAICYACNIQPGKAGPQIVMKDPPEPPRGASGANGNGGGR